jgi:hypothetical protein
MEGLQLIRKDFDSMENHNPYIEEVIETFINEDGKNAHVKCQEYLSKLTISPYLGMESKCQYSL